MYGERSENFRKGLTHIRGFGEQARIAADRLCGVYTATKQRAPGTPTSKEKVRAHGRMTPISSREFC